MSPPLKRRRAGPSAQPARWRAATWLYWLAALVISVALVVGLVLLFEFRDASSVGALSV